MTTLLLLLGTAIWALGRKHYTTRHLFAFLAGWAMPGLGYFVMKQRGKAIFFAVSLAAMYLAGLFISNFGLVGIDDNAYYYICQFGSLPTMILGELLSHRRPFVSPNVSLAFLDPAQLYMCLAPLVGYALALSVFEPPASLFQPQSRPAERAESATGEHPK